MLSRIILISGPVSSGKSKLAEKLQAEFGAHLVKTRDILQEITGTTDNDRLSLQLAGDKLDLETGGRWVLDALHKAEIGAKQGTTFVVDSVRIAKQIEHIRNAYKYVTHLHLTAPLDVLKQRYDTRYQGKPEVPTYEKIRANETEQKIESLAEYADVVIDTNRCAVEDVLVRAASRMSLYGRNDVGYVDVIIGGQYGSEGKGQIAAYIAKEYDLLVRVGGPNAGHKVFEEPEAFTHHQLPSGTRRCDAKLLLGPGMVINVDDLLKEIAKCNVEYDRLRIDPQAIVITPEDIEAEGELEKTIGSTRRGVGYATARKITQRSPQTKLAKDVPELKPFVEPALKVLTRTFARNGRVLLEGTQGTGLSIHHGSYPHVTSRDTTVSGCLADAGISPRLLRRTIMVCRTLPIRVESPKTGDSGPMSQEITFEEVSARSGVPLEELRKTEKTSTTLKNRRIGEFDWDLVRRAAFLNGPTDIALTFADYIRIENRKAMRFEQLTKPTINMIEEIEHVTRARVSLIATGFNHRSIIDRREW